MPIAPKRCSRCTKPTIFFEFKTAACTYLRIPDHVGLCTTTLARFAHHRPVMTDTTARPCYTHPLEILWQDEDMVVVYKPAGWLVPAPCGVQLA